MGWAAGRPPGMAAKLRWWGSLISTFPLLLVLVLLDVPLNHFLDFVGVDLAVLAVAHLQDNHRISEEFSFFCWMPYLRNTFSHYFLVALFANLLSVVERLEDHLDLLNDPLLPLDLFQKLQKEKSGKVKPTYEKRAGG